MASYRFEDMEVWKLGTEIGDDLFDIADLLWRKKILFDRFQQLSKMISTFRKRLLN